MWWASVSGKNRRKDEMYNLKRDRRGSRWCAEKDKYNSLLTDVMTGNDFGTQVGNATWVERFTLGVVPFSFTV